MVSRVVLLAAALGFAALRGPAFGQEGRPVTPEEFAKQELFRKWGVRERAAAERTKKAQVDQANYDALHYQLTLDIDVEHEEISGTLSLTAAALAEDPSSLVLDLLNGLTVSAVRENGSPASFTHAEDLITVSLSTPYGIGDTIRVDVDYAGNPAAENTYLTTAAFTFGKHGPTVDQRIQVVIYTISEPYFARAWWPCKDVPDDKATARLRVTVPDTLIVASNGVLEDELILPGARKTYVWREKYPIATHLVSLAVSNYEVFREYFRHAPSDSMEVTYFVYPEHLDAARIGFAMTVPMIEFFSELFGLYPFVDEKYGMAEFAWSGAMEHQTCTSMGSFYASRRGGYDRVVAHELAHQWWGDLVTPAEWADVWLNEGFATYAEALWTEHIGGFEAYRDYMATRQLSRGFRGTVYDPDALFGTTVYWKGAWVLHMLRHVMGNAPFFDALRAYGSEVGFGYKNATTADFQSVCEEYRGGDLSWFFDEWVYGEGQPRWAYYWTQSESGGAGTVFLGLRQLQSEQVFRMPLDIRFFFEGGGDTTITVWSSEIAQEYQFALGRPVASIAIDPDGWVLKTVEGRGSLTLGVFPNPFNGTTSVGFELGTVGSVELNVYDITGARVKRLLKEDRGPGYHEIQWKGDNDDGEAVVSGVYFVRVRTGQGEMVKKAVLVK